MVNTQTDFDWPAELKIVFCKKNFIIIVSNVSIGTLIMNDNSSIGIGS